MIYTVLTKAETEALLENLRASLPGTAKIFYVIRNYIRGLFPGFEVIVDKWPTWTCIILRPVTDEMVPLYFKNMYICHAKTVSALKYFIQRPCVVDWTKPATFTGVPRDLVPVLNDMSRKYGGKLSAAEARLMYAWPRRVPPDVPQVPDGLRLTNLEPEHASLMREDWEGSRNVSDMEGYFRSVIENFASSCLIDRNGELLAYICMQYNGSMAMLYVRPEHRDKGYFQIILSDLTRTLINKGEIAYGFIPTHDISLVNMSRELGFEWVPQGNMVWMEFTPIKTVLARQMKIADDIRMNVSSDRKMETHKLLINAIPLALQNWGEL